MSSELTITPEHFARIVDFINARLEPLIQQAVRDSSDTLPALYALEATVTRRTGAPGLLGDYPTQDAAGRAVTRVLVESAWLDLRGLARHWRAHPDFQPEFSSMPWELTGTEGTAVMTAGDPS